MSQRTSFIEEVMTWQTEECRHNLHTALPKLLNAAETNQENSHDVVRLILHNFSVLCEIQQLEHLIFAQLSRQLCTMYEHIFHDIEELISSAGQHGQQVQQPILTLIQRAMDVLSGLEVCVQHVFSQCEERIEMSDVHSLLPTTVRVVKVAYTHCKTSSSIYGPCLGFVSDQLSALFKKAHILQMALVSAVDRISLSCDSTETDLTDMAAVIHGLHSLCQISANLDVKITVTLWKVISRLACQHRVLLDGYIDYSPILQSLCHDMLSSYDYITQLLPRQQGSVCLDDKAFTKHLKILGFQMKILVKFTEQFVTDLTDACVQDIYVFIRKSHRHIPPSLEVRHVPQNYTDDIQKHFTNGLDPLLTKLVSHSVFIEEATRPDTENSDHLVRAMILLSVCDLLEGQTAEVREKWMLGGPEETRLSVLQALFTAIQQCYVELCVPVSLPDGHNVTRLYDYIVMRLCALVGSYPEQHFHHVELCLLENLLQPRILPALIATDIWCFIARYGSAELCRSHCTFLTRLYVSEEATPSPQCCHLGSLLRRLLKFLAPQHHKEYIDLFSPASHPNLWAIVPLHVFSGDTCAALVEDIITMCVGCLHDWMEDEHITADQARKLDYCLGCLSNALDNPFIVENHVGEREYSTVLDRSIEVMCTLQAESVGSMRVLQRCVAGVLRVFACLVTSAHNSHILTVLEFIEWYLVLSTRRSSDACHQRSSDACEAPGACDDVIDNAPASCDDVKMAALLFLQNLGKKSLSPYPQQAEILRVLPRIFTTLLGDLHPVIRHRTVQIFAEFAEETPHESVVPDSLASDHGLQERVVAYLSQVSCHSSLPESSDDAHLHDQHRLMCEYTRTDLTQLYIPTTWPPPTAQSDITWLSQTGAHTQPSSKRQKTDDDPGTAQTSDELTAIVNQLTECVNQLTEVSANQLPDCVKPQVRHCYRELEKLL